ncbi:hypothetical protein N7478_003797 [Penicillium angulare]|uniref:uncharacterized protein n=1 Tax=Penicillium angulare TaxID=116970 RepID=UPI002540C58B|nr:uncharacterized protein N7478_003797 [Penicillium angulare]KAJ5288111.1 hypothetical protein N7478_003797 [Penicillium angulare]
MEPRHENMQKVQEVDHFGFDPASPTVRTKDRKKEKNGICGPDTREIRNLSYEMGIKLSFQETESHSGPKSHVRKENYSSTSFKLPDKSDNWATNDFWGFDPAERPTQRSATSRSVRAQHNRDDKDTRGMRIQ